MQESLYDVVIIGAGAAGCATAISLLSRCKLNLAIIDSKLNQTNRIGESLSPAANLSLQKLGLLASFKNQQHRPYYGNRSYWGDRAGIDDFMFHPFGPGWHLDRSRFDEFMVECARSRGAKVERPSKFIGARKSDKGWSLTVQRKGDGPRQIQTKYVVDASGHAAAFSRNIGIRRSFLDQLYCFFAHVPAYQTHDHYSLLETTEEGWWYAAALPIELLVFMFVTDRENLEAYRQSSKLLASFDQTTQIKKLTDKSISKTSVMPVTTGRLESFGGFNWLAVGDAAFSVDPLLAGGITRALDQGIHAGSTLANHFMSLEDWKVQLQEYITVLDESYRLQLDVRRRLYQEPPCNSAFWKRRIL